MAKTKATKAKGTREVSKEGLATKRLLPAIKAELDLMSGEEDRPADERRRLSDWKDKLTAPRLVNVLNGFDPPVDVTAFSMARHLQPLLDFMVQHDATEIASTSGPTTTPSVVKTIQDKRNAMALLCQAAKVCFKETPKTSEAVKDNLTHLGQTLLRYATGHPIPGVLLKNKTDAEKESIKGAASTLNDRVVEAIANTLGQNVKAQQPTLVAHINRLFPNEQ